MELILIRHGRPERIDHDPNGANPGLTELGHRQAKLMAEYMEPETIDAMYVSCQQRAIDTAGPLAEAKGLTPTIIDDIAEFDLGETSYIPGEEAEAYSDEDIDALVASLTGEAFVKRVLDAVASIIDSHPGQRVVAVCHGGVISTVLNDILGVDGRTYLNASYTSVSRVMAKQSGFRSVASFNECPWLRTM